MGVTDTQYSLILLHALPSSYEAVATILLASGLPTLLKHSKITVCLLDEEGRWVGSNSSLNMAAKAPIKGTGKGKKKGHSNLTCRYCNKKGHIQPDCCKKKDDADKKKKEESGSSSGGNKPPILMYWYLHLPPLRTSITMLALPCMLLSACVG
jgi:hypothetical protein